MNSTSVHTGDAGDANTSNTLKMEGEKASNQIEDYVEIYRNWKSGKFPGGWIECQYYV